MRQNEQTAVATPQGCKGSTPKGAQDGGPPFSTALPILQTLAPVARLSVRDIRLRSGADTWPEGRLGQTLDLLRERGLIVQDGVDCYALSVAGRREVNRG